ncbi:DNA-binding protein [Flavobacterium amnicola]|uniref:DNA-binding protein n=1 Tax=Flavobacterium amnicola TaxID=2506422 RepID=A0A4V1N1P5_9FLAO|nr:helix-turn-helix domain-containing protein [Flavobacterium amnicola]RXR16311.1 DNA-binding protein [Flavobacterium amnicola]
MSSNIEVLRICQYCNNEFIAKKTTTKHCSHKCASRAYKQRLKVLKIEESNAETFKIKNKTIVDLKEKEFLTVKEVSLLLGFSTRTLYRMINENKLNAHKFTERKTIVKRSDIDLLFEQPKPQQSKTNLLEPIKNPEIIDCYTISEIVEKFNISNGALYNLIKRKNINKFSKGKYTYIAKRDIDIIF